MTTVLAIDPGPERSAWLRLIGAQVESFGYPLNEELLKALKLQLSDSGACVIEKIASYGMPVGAEVFETVFWSGRFCEAFGDRRTHRITRGEVKMHLCHSMKAKDGNIRQALIDRFGGPQAIKKGGELYKVSGDVWAALAVAVCWWDRYGAGVCGRVG